MASNGKNLEKKITEIKAQFMKSGNNLYLIDQSATNIYGGDTKQADFGGVAKGRAFLLECKSSDKYRTFKECRPKDYIKSAQYAGAKIQMRAGGYSLFVFYSEIFKITEYWCGSDICDAYKNGWKEYHTPIHTHSRLGNKTVLEALDLVFPLLSN